MDNSDEDWPMEKIDIGHNHSIKYLGWFPDRDINPQYAHLPDIEKCGLIVEHPNLKGGGTCVSGVTFRGEIQKEVFPSDHCWDVLSWEPLTLSPSLLCLRCGDHGYIKEGRWVPA